MAQTQTEKTWTPERYDGKSRKDDMRKYGAIAAVVIVLFIGLQVGFHFLKKANAPDYYVLFACNSYEPTEEMTADLTEAVAEVIGDRNGNGKKTADFKVVHPDAWGDYSQLYAFFTGDYVLFFMLEPERYGEEDLFVSTTDLEGTKIYQDSGIPFPMYACILNTADDDVEDAQRILELLQNQE